MPLPATGELNWGDELNDYILNTVQSTAQSALTGLNQHTTADDPHGSKAYSDTATQAITSLKGQANGYAELGADGKLKSGQAPAGGGRTNAYDVVKDYGAVGNGTVDDTAAIQNALNACAATGGGEVWIPNGTFIVNSLEIKAPGNLWLHLSNGAVLKRKASSTAQNFISNFNSTTTYTGYAGPGQLMISGGTIDGNAANNATACTLLSLAHANGVVIRDMIIQNVTDWNAIHLSGCAGAIIESTVIRGLRLVGSNTQNSPAIKLSAPISSTIIPGMGSTSYDSTVCSGIAVEDCDVVPTPTYGSFGSLVASVDDTTSATLAHSSIHVNNNTITNSNGYGIRAVAWKDATITNNIFKDCNGMISLEVPGSRPSGATVDGNIGATNNIGDNIGVINKGASIVNNAIQILGRYGTGASPTSVPMRDVVLDLNKIETFANNGYGIYVLNIADCLISKNTVSNSTSTSSPLPTGILVHNSFYIRILGNRVRDIGSVGIYLGALDPSNDNFGCAHSLVNDNSVVNCGNSAVSINYSGYVVATGNNVQNTTNGVGLYNGTNNSLVNNTVAQNVGTNRAQYQSGAGGGNQLGGANIGGSTSS